MLSLRDLEFLSSLARRKHFARAAEDCGVSQPAFSMRIQKIEEKLGIPVVKRGNRFQGFTTEGETLVRHSYKIVDALKIMEQEFLSARGDITGTLAIGVIPTSVIFAAKVVTTLQTEYPGIRVKLQTAPSLSILQGLENGQYDVGITYAEGIANDLLRADALYDETFLLLTPEHFCADGAEAITWADAAALPLCLLEPGMQNRAILDGVFRDLGLVPRVITESNGFLAAMVLAAQGLAATIVPQHLVDTFGRAGKTKALKLVEPTLEKQVCLISLDRDLSLPAVGALRDIINKQN